MKNINKIFLFILLVISLLSSCKKEFVDVKNINQYPTDQYWTKPEHAKSAIVVAYAALKYAGVNEIAYLTIFHGMDPNVTNEGAGYVAYQNLFFFASDANVESIYHGLYSGLGKANLALEKIPNCNLPEADLNTYMGEAYFLRAFFSHRLTTLFYSPPLLTNVLDVSKAKALSNTDQELWFDQIKADCYKAIEKLPESWDNGNLGRVTKATAWALLGRTYMDDEVWDSAEYAFNKIIVDKVGNRDLIMPQGTDSLDYVYAYLCNYSLNELVNGSKVYKAENNQESIFEIQNAENTSSAWNLSLNGYGCDGSRYNSFYSIIGFWNIGVANTFVSKYESITPTATVPLHKDARYYATAYKEGDTIECWGTGVFCEKIMTADPAKSQDPLYASRLQKGAFSPAGVSIKKYMYPLYPYVSNDGKTDPNNFRLITYSDVLLNQAEVKYQLGKDNESLDLINQIRNRVGLPDTSGNVLNILVREIEMEKAIEGKWMEYVMRWARTTNKQTGTPYFIDPTTIKSQFKRGKNEYFPIPQVEIDYMVEGDLKQNPGW